MADTQYNQRWIEINADALTSNVRVLKTLLGPAKLMAVVKAGAYGHGAGLIAPILRAAGADAFGVTLLTEAMELLHAGTDPSATPILCFAPVSDPGAIEFAIRSRLHLSVCDRADLQRVQEAESRTGVGAHLHLKIDTGMGRLGVRADQAFDLLQQRRNWAGAYTHFPNATAADAASVVAALHGFQALIDEARHGGIGIERAHCANTAAALRLPETHLDMARIGTALYGQLPSAHVPMPDGLRDDTFVLKARIVQVRELRKGDSVGYGSEFTAPAPMQVAVIPIGFADGFGVAPVSLNRGLRGLGRVLAPQQLSVMIGGKPCRVLGRIAMQMIVVDISSLPSGIEAGVVAEIPIRRLSASASIPRVLVTGR